MTRRSLLALLIIPPQWFSGLFARRKKPATGAGIQLINGDSCVFTNCKIYGNHIYASRPERD